MCGTLAVYSDEPWFFQDKEVALLAEAASDISFALDNFAEKEAHKRKEIIAENERLFSATMIESMPGVLYFYDEHGRFLRWNRNFESVSGYSGEEIARMHPLDFFPAPERELLKGRIAEVFERGSSFIEANFRAKDGSSKPLLSPDGASNSMASPASSAWGWTFPTASGRRRNCGKVWPASTPPRRRRTM